MKLDKLIEFMETVAPREMALEYDNVGLLLGRREADVKKVLTCLDCTIDVVREAIQKGCELIVCHHPILFSGVKRITDDTKEGEMLLLAIENNIAIFAAHTNLDFAEGGLNDYFLEKIGYDAIDTIIHNEGRIFDVGEICLKDLCERVKAAFNLEHVRVMGEAHGVISRCALCTGSGKSLVHEAALKADCYITGDMGHHDILNLSELGCNYIEISHYDSEKIAMELLNNKISEEFPRLEVFQSIENKNPLTFM